jgi:hypothetical protein
MFVKHHLAARLKQLLAAPDPEKDLRAGAYLHHCALAEITPTFQSAAEGGFGLHQNTLKKALTEAEALGWIRHDASWRIIPTSEGAPILRAMREEFDRRALRLPKPWEIK